VFSANPSTSSAKSPGRESGLEEVLERIQRLTNGTDQKGKSIAPSADRGNGPVSYASTAAPSGLVPEATGKGADNYSKTLDSAKGTVVSTGAPLSLKVTGQLDEPMLPLEPATLFEAGLSETIVEELAMRFLFNRGEASGRQVADQLKISFRLIEPILTRLKSQQMIAYAGASSINDYVYVMTDAGRDRAKRYMQKTTYFGSAPVPLSDYIASVKLQSVEHQHPSREALRNAFSDLLVSPALLARLGPAINSGRGMFLYGYPGNGKTSIAERVTRTFGQFIWIPRCVLVEGDIIRIYDPMMHEECEPEAAGGLIDHSPVDPRWIRIRRPTIVAGGELTMSMLEVSHNPISNVCDSPLQIKSNCGVLLIDDFGRQRMTVDELLNRWIVPLEKRYDYLSLHTGKKIQVPFDQLVIFSTNLEPKNLVDDAFLRRIPYKIEVQNPTEEAFRKLFEIMCKSLKIPFRQEMIDYLVAKHYKPFNRPYRNCHPRDLLLQVRSFCYYNSVPLELRFEYLDFAVENYFSIM
jgi:hypothetical protein